MGILFLYESWCVPQNDVVGSFSFSKTLVLLSRRYNYSFYSLKFLIRSCSSTFVYFHRFFFSQLPALGRITSIILGISLKTGVWFSCCHLAVLITCFSATVQIINFWFRFQIILTMQIFLNLPVYVLAYRTRGYSKVRLGETKTHQKRIYPVTDQEDLKDEYCLHFILKKMPWEKKLISIKRDVKRGEHFYHWRKLKTRKHTKIRQL